MMPAYQQPLITLDTSDSTNLFAQELLNNHQVQHGTVIRANNQINGRGQRGNKWMSAPGQNLTFSIVLFPPGLAVTRHFELNMVFSMAVYDYLMAMGIDQVKVKWPNDILVNKKKVAGILLENTIRGELFNTIIAGIGINVNQENFDGEYAIAPVSIINIRGQISDIDNALQEVLHFIMLRYEQMLSNKSEELIKDYHHALFRFNEPSDFISDGIRWIGICRGVTEEGHLMVENTNGKIVKHSFEGIKMIC